MERVKVAECASDLMQLGGLVAFDRAVLVMRKDRLADPVTTTNIASSTYPPPFAACSFEIDRSC